MAQSVNRQGAMHWAWWLSVIPMIGLLFYLTRDFFGFWPALIFSALVIPVSFYLLVQDSRRLLAAFRPLAVKYDGSITRASPLNFPALSFTENDREYRVNAMPNSGASAPSGPFSNLSLTGQHGFGGEARITRASPLVQGAVAMVAPALQATTGDPAFDRAFRLGGPDQAALAALLDDALRATLVASTLPNLRINLKGAQITVFRDNLVKDAGEVEELLALANRIANAIEGDGGSSPG